MRTREHERCLALTSTGGERRSDGLPGRHHIDTKGHRHASPKRCARNVARTRRALIGVDVRSADQTLVAAGSAWKYNDSGANLGTRWRAPRTTTAPGHLARRSSATATATKRPCSRTAATSTNRHITYYFRRAFTVANPAAFAALTVRFVRDDGCVIYVNGVEVVRSNMPTGTMTLHDARHDGHRRHGRKRVASSRRSIRPLLVAGTNVIAVEMHQQSPTSTDISFDLELRATEAQAPHADGHPDVARRPRRVEQCRP